MTVVPLHQSEDGYNCYVHGGGHLGGWGCAHGDVHCCDDGVGHVGLDESSSS